MDHFQLSLIYIENRAICGTETAKLTGGFVPRACSGYIWSFYRRNKNRCMQKIKADQAWKRKNMTFLFTTKYTIPPAHMHAIENGSTVPTGCKK